MTIKTRITELIGIRYPVIQGAMQWVSDSKFAAAVSNAGGLGTISACAFSDADALRAEIRKIKLLTDKPFSVNISMLPETTQNEQTADYLQVIFEEGVPVLETAGRDPGALASEIVKQNIFWIHKVSAIRFAKKAESLGANAVCLVGFEAAGNPGMDEVTTQMLVQRAVRELQIPVIAGGGVATGRGIVAMLALGAEAVLMGSRFVATKECAVHDNFKQWILQSTETDTMVIQRSIKKPVRVIKNPASLHVLEMEQNGAELPEMIPVMAGNLSLNAMEKGDILGYPFAIGQDIGLINDIPSIDDLIQSLMSEAEETINRLVRTTR